MHPDVKLTNLKMDNNVGLLYIVKIMETYHKILSVLRKEIWEYLLLKGIIMAVEYLGFLIKKIISVTINEGLE